jgi:hypothetical protein
MNLDELRQKMASDATKENEELKHEISVLREQLCYSKKDHETVERLLINDCRALANRCWVLTQGCMCCFCAMDTFKCPHAWNDEQKNQSC